MNKIVQTVELILGDSQLARDSDTELLVAVLDKLGADLTVQQVAILRSFSVESITRQRRKLQEKGLYPPSPEVAKRRRLKSYEVQQNAPTARPERLQVLINQPRELVLDEL